MNTVSIIMMLLILSVTWGGFLYLINKANKKEKSRGGGMD
jgi:hypothetical protein